MLTQILEIHVNSKYMNKKGVVNSAAAAAADYMLPRAPGNLVDIGANLTDHQFTGKYNNRSKYHESDLGDVMNRAAAVGVSNILVTSSTLKESRNAVDLIKKWSEVPGTPAMRTTIGVHPCSANVFDKHQGGGGAQAYLDEMIQFAKDNRDLVAAVGEFGIDWDRLHFCDKETQHRYFLLQFDLARACQLPLFLHCRGDGAHDWFLDRMEEHADCWTTGVVHSFDGSLETAQRILAHPGLFIGLNGCSLRDPASHPVVASLPLDRICLETDAPWCGIKQTHASWPHVQTHFPQKDKKKWAPGHLVKGRSEPCQTIQVAEAVAGIMGETVAKVCETTTNTAMKLFWPDKA